MDTKPKSISDMVAFLDSLSARPRNKLLTQMFRMLWYFDAQAHDVTEEDTMTIIYEHFLALLDEKD